MPAEINIRNILVKHWGHPSFRPLQEDIIMSVLESKDTLALLPTGGGKSVCFQVPALAREGICVVVTPLISLMKDQVENLVKKGIKAVAIYSGMHRNQIDIAYNDCLFGGYKFLYVSPERLESEQFIQFVQKLNVNLLAVDEAHCISQWGYDFRPPYLRIIDVRKYIPGVAVLALTATATPRVVEDIQEKLGFPEKNVFQKSFERKNLTYAVIREEDKMGRLIRVLEKVPGSGIIYVRNRRKTKEVAEFLQKNKISADFYHAGLDSQSRSVKQDAWKRGTKRVIVATNAFGMGIDKPDVRFVIHLDLTDSIEAYFQEAGRAGRDEKRSYAISLYEEGDVINARKNLENSYPEPKMIRNIYDALGNFLQLAVGSGKDAIFDFDLYSFCRQFRFSPVVAYSSLKFLEKEGYLYLNEAFGSPSQVHMKVQREDLYRIQIEHRKFDNFIKMLLRSYSGLFSGFTRISEKELGKRSNHTPEQIKEILLQLVKLEVVDYIPQSLKPQLTYSVERLYKDHLRFSDKNYKDRKKEAMLRMQAVIDYVTSRTRCRSQLLLEYFGEEQTKRCGRCDVCLERNKVDVNELEFDNILKQIKPILQEKPSTLQEILFDIRDYSEEMVINVIRWLEDNGKIVRDDDNYYRWRKQYKLEL